MLVKYFLLIALSICIGTGCKKKDSASPATAASSGQTNVTAAVSAPAPEQPSDSPPGYIPPVAPPKSTVPTPPPRFVTANADNMVRENVSGTVDGFLTQQLRTFIQQKNRMPESFSEFVSARLDSLPRAPEGKRWVIDGASLEVKAVAK
jgi:hypothetical protein